MRIYRNEQYILEVLLMDFDGQRIAGKDVFYKIYRSSDNVEIDSGTLADMGNGLYKGEYLFSETGQYRIEYLMPDGWDDIVETIIVDNHETSTISNIYDMVRRILGLSQENYILEPIEYNVHLQLTKARIKIYENATDCEQEINPIDVYNVEAVYDVDGRLQKYKVVKE